MTTIDLIAKAVSAILGTLAALHLYWAAGGLWPGRSTRKLIDTVIGNPRRNRMPPAWLTAFVGLALAAIAILPLIIAPVFQWSALALLFERDFGSHGRSILGGTGVPRSRHCGLPAVLAPPPSSAAVRDPGCVPLFAAMPALGAGLYLTSIWLFWRSYRYEPLTRTVCPGLMGSRAGNRPRPSASCRRAAPASAARTGNRRRRSGSHPAAAPDRLCPARAPRAVP